MAYSHTNRFGKSRGIDCRLQRGSKVSSKEEKKTNSSVNTSYNEEIQALRAVYRKE